MEGLKEYRVNIEQIKTDFVLCENSTVNHKHDKKIGLLPYTTKDNNLDMNFKSIAGAFSRKICGKKLNEDFNEDLFTQNVTEKIGEYEGKNSKNIFKDIIKSMFLDNGNLVDFDIKTLNYIKASSNEEKIADFLACILSNEDLKKNVDRNYNREVKNILYKLVLESLPQLKDTNFSNESYKCILPFVKDIFVDDFIFLISNEELYKENLYRFLEFYYMFYVSQMAIKLNKFEKMDLNMPEKLYYTLSWESLSKNRTAYKFGLELLRVNLGPLYSHAVTLELLNYCDFKEKLTYYDFYKLFEESDICESKENIDLIIETYQKYVVDVKWNELELKERNSGNEAFDKVYRLYQIVDYQFNKSARQRAYKAYKNWFVKFVESKFSKRRGPLGYNLNLTEDDIILLTKICIKDKGKLKLNFLFDEFEKRGVCFDRDSKLKVIQLYEKLNILEKKSDSGDAQYVRSVL